jgi:choline-sulfatase
VHYGGLPPQLFGLETDPGDRSDLAGEPEQAGRLQAFQMQLGRICDPAAVDRRAKADQAALIERHGGRDAIVAKGGFGATPPPGQKPEFE